MPAGHAYQPAISDEAPIVCLVCTYSGCEARVVATLSVRMRFTLAQVRAALLSLAAGKATGLLQEPPINVTDTQAALLSAHELHPFDFTQPFHFVRIGTAQGRVTLDEGAITLREVFPRYPRSGSPGNTSFHIQPVNVTVVVPRWVRRAADAKVTDPAFVEDHSQTRVALAAVFVATGARRGAGPCGDGAVTERVLQERLWLQATALDTRHFDLPRWCEAVTRWNGNVRDYLGRTVLHDVTQFANEPALRFLLTQDYIQRDAPDREHNTALHLAVRANRTLFVKLLLDAGANVMATNLQGNTALHLALLYRRAAIVGLLCSRLRADKVPVAALGAVPNALGFTAVQLFALYTPSVYELSAGATVVALKTLLHHFLFDQNTLRAREALSGATVLHRAARAGNADVLLYLLSELSPAERAVAGDWVDYRGQNVLHAAAAGGEVRCVTALLESLTPTTLRARDVNGDTPLLVALKARRVRAAEALLTHCSAGAVAPDVADRAGMTALHLACAAGWTSIVAALVTQHGASVGLVAAVGQPEGGTYWCNTTLVQPARHKRRPHTRFAHAPRRDGVAATRAMSPETSTPRVVYCRTGAGTDGVALACRSFAECGYTALRCAILAAKVLRRDLSEMMQLLCDHGALADVAAMEDYLCHLLVTRQEGVASAVAERYTAHMAELAATNSLMRRLCATGCVDGVRWCIEHHCYNELQHDAASLLTCSAAAGDVVMVDLLLRAGADPNAHCGVDGALHAAIKAGHGDVVARLLHGGARAHVGQCGLGGAESTATRGAREEDGEEDTSVWSALVVAAVYGREDILRGLLGMAHCDPHDTTRALAVVLRNLFRHPRDTATRALRLRLAFFLAQAYDPNTAIGGALAEDVMHPVELLHLAGGEGAFEVVGELLRRMCDLPPTTWAALRVTAPPPPATRPLREVTFRPALDPAPPRAGSRLWPDPVTGKGGLYTHPTRFTRLEVPSYRRFRDDAGRTGGAHGLMRHRLQQRDVFSYCAAAGQFELVETMLYVLHLTPWRQPDVRGWTMSDYALETPHQAMLRHCIALDIAPCGRGHRRRLIADHQTTRLRQALMHCHGAMTTEAAATGLPAEGARSVLQRCLEHLIRLGAADDDVEMILRAAIAVGAGQQLRDQSALFTVLRSCVRYGRAELLRRVSAVCTDTQLPLLPSVASTTSPERGEASLLLLAVHVNDTDLVDHLLRAGCSPCAPSSLAHDMLNGLPPLADAVHCCVTPLYLAAAEGRWAVLQLLLAYLGARPLRAEDCVDEEHTKRDALHALLRYAVPLSTPPTPRRGGAARVHPPYKEDEMLARTVRTLAAVGHGYHEACVLRLACARGLFSTARALIDCYGAAPLLADLQPEVRHSLFYFVAEPRLVELLRRRGDQGASGLLVRAAAGGGDGRCELTELAQRIRREDYRYHSMTLVDYALSHNCVEGAMLMVALGLTGRGDGLVRPGSGYTHEVRRTCAVLHYHHARHAPKSAGHDTAVGHPLALLHTTLRLGYEDVATALTTAMSELGEVCLLDRDLAAASAATSTSSSLSLRPSLYALAALHHDGWRWVSAVVERAMAAVSPDVRQRLCALRACDFFLLVWYGSAPTGVVDRLCRTQQDMRSVLTRSFTLADVQAECDGGLWHALRRPHHSGGLRLAGGRYVLTGLTPLICAVAAGAVEWVRYMLLIVCGDSGGVDVDSLRGAVVSRCDAPRQRALRDPRPACNSDSTDTPFSPLVSSGEVHVVDVLVLCTALLAEYAPVDAARSTSRPVAAAYGEIFLLLLAVPGVLHEENSNVIAIALAALQQWTLLQRLFAHVDRTYAHTSEGGQATPAAITTARFLHPILESEVPCVLRHIVGSARHVMHVAARTASREVLLEVARHALRGDVESALDADGHTSLYHALRRRQECVAVVRTFLELRVPLRLVCSKRRNRTPLLVAVTTPQSAMELVQLLLPTDQKLTTSIDLQKDRQGNTALMLAAAYGQLAVVELLLARGAEPGLRNAAGLTAAMLAANAGHDHVAAPLALHFSTIDDLVAGAGFTATTLLHCAAFGGCWRTAEAVVSRVAASSRTLAAQLLCGDDEGHTALYLAYAFGHARVLRTILALYHRVDSSSLAKSAIVPADDVPVDPDDSGAVLGSREERIVRGDAGLPSYGWLRGVLAVGATLRQHVAPHASHNTHTTSSRLALLPGELICGPTLPPLGPDEARLHWCARCGHCVGVRVLADLNITDTCGALHAAARAGQLEVVQLLLTLQMSDPLQHDAKTGFCAFEVAAMAGHTSCAQYLLKHTPLDTRALLAAVRPTSPHGHGILHRLAAVCDGEVCVQLLKERLLLADLQGPTALEEETIEAVLQELQRPDEAGLTPLEYTIAMGRPAALLRLTQVQQALGARLSLQCGASGKYSEAAREHGVSISGALFDYLPGLSPAVRVLLYDVFNLEAVAHVAGIDGNDGDKSGDAPSCHVVHDDKDDDRGDKKRNGGSAALVAAKSRRRGETRLPVRRLRFADVRLLGINTLSQDAFCAMQLSPLFTPDHERRVLRRLLRCYPYRIRYSPDSLHGLPLAEQTRLLQWLGSSLVLSSYGDDEAALVADDAVSTIEVQVVSQRGELSLRLVPETGVLLHTLYLSHTTRALVMPDVAQHMPSRRTAYRHYWRRHLDRLARRATTALRTLSHPLCRGGGSVVLEWDIERAVTGGATLREEQQRYDPIYMRLENALRLVEDYLSHQLGPLLQTVRESDLAAVLSELGGGGSAVDTGGNQGSAASIVFRFVAAASGGGDDGVTWLAKTSPALFIRPSSSRSGERNTGDTASMACVIAFDETSSIDPLPLLRQTLTRALSADVALVQVHYARDEFLLRLGQIWQRYAKLREGGVNGDAPSTGSDRRVAVPLFAFELEQTTMSDVPTALIHTALRDAAAAVEWLVVGGGATALSSRSRLRRLHFDCIIAERLVHRLRTVSVLLSTRHGPFAHFTADGRLQLCLTLHLAPTRDELVATLRACLVRDEVARYLAELPDFVADAEARLQTRLPQAHFVLDIASLTRGDKGAHSAGAARRDDAVATDTRDLAAMSKDDGGGDVFVLSALHLLLFRHSAQVLRPLLEGVGVGWDTALGTAVRTAVRQVTLRLAPLGAGGWCTLTEDGNFVYDCPLQCIARHTYTNSAWQLLSAPQIASLLLLNLVARVPTVGRLVDRHRSCACWCEVRVRSSRVVAGRQATLLITARDLLNRPRRRSLPGHEDQFAFLGSVTRVQVRACGEDSGRPRAVYRVSFAAPTRAGWYKWFILLHHQQLCQSPLRLHVRAAPVRLDRTRVLSDFDLVIARRPFELQLGLRDALDNPLDRSPSALEVGATIAVRETGSSRAGDLNMPSAERDDGDLLSLLHWTVQGTATLVLRVCVHRPVGQFQLQVKLSCNDETGARMTHTMTIPLYCAHAALAEQLTRLARDLPLDTDRRGAEQKMSIVTQPGKPASASVRERLFFRKVIRDAERAQLRRDRASVSELLRGLRIAPCPARPGRLEVRRWQK